MMFKSQKKRLTILLNLNQKSIKDFSALLLVRMFFNLFPSDNISVAWIIQTDGIKNESLEESMETAHKNFCGLFLF